MKQDVVIPGDCTAILKTLPSESVDFILTDPPYFVGYKDRSGRGIRNDRHPDQVLEAFRDLCRVLKPNRLCVSFYGWKHVDAFAAIWKRVDLRPVGHIVFPKSYVSGQKFLSYAHECAYLLAKGKPAPPDKPISDVLRWHYTGNHGHPSEKAVDTVKPIIQAFTEAGDLVLDPFAGSGSTLVAAALLGRHYIGIELEQEYCDLARRRLAGVQRHLASVP